MEENRGQPSHLPPGDSNRMLDQLFNQLVASFHGREEEDRDAVGLRALQSILSRARQLNGRNQIEGL